MKPNKTAQQSKTPELKGRFRLLKLEERIAPKGPAFSKGRRCWSF